MAGLAQRLCEIANDVSPERGENIREAIQYVRAWEILKARGWNVGQFWSDQSRWGLRTSGGYDLPHRLHAVLRDREWHDPVQCILDTDEAARKLEAGT